LNGLQLPFSHDSTHSIRGASDTLIVEFLPDPPVYITATVTPEYHLDQITDILIGLLRRGGLGGVVIAATSIPNRTGSGPVERPSGMGSGESQQGLSWYGQHVHSGFPVLGQEIPPSHFG
jgi:hypothetical protein